jgi:hypothetical protein
MISYPQSGVENLGNKIVHGSYENTMAMGIPHVKPVTSSQNPGFAGIPATGVPSRMSRIGMCYYHPDLPAVYICNRCGRPICRDCAKNYSGLILCPQCYSMSIPRPAPIYPPFLTYR